MSRLSNMELNKLFPAILTVLLIGVLVVLAIIIFVTLGGSFDPQLTSSSETILTNSEVTLLQTPTSLSATRLNQTWLDFDGVDDVVILNSNETNSISFWYKNETLDWTFITNSSGTLYVDAVATSPDQYPVFYNGTDYLIGKEGSSNFFNGSMDDFRVYDSTLEQELVTLIFQDYKL